MTCDAVYIDDNTTCGEPIVSHIVVMCVHEHRRELDVCDMHLTDVQSPDSLALCQDCFAVGYSIRPVAVSVEVVR